MDGRVFRVVIYDISYSPPEDPVTVPIEASEPLECSVCNKKFEKKSRLKVHLRENHINQKVKCDICGRSYTRKSSLKLHTVKKHINTNPVIPESSFDETYSNRKVG
jgi:hypothetical protein